MIGVTGGTGRLARLVIEQLLPKTDVSIALTSSTLGASAVFATTVVV